ncbi:MAG: hypothetical protein R6U95_00640 [Bacteroidales bacterium]
MKTIIFLCTVIFFVSCNYDPITGPYITHVSIPDSVHETDTTFITYTSKAGDAPLYKTDINFAHSLILDSTYKHSQEKEITCPISFFNHTGTQTLTISTYDTENLRASSKHTLHVKAIQPPAIQLLPEGVHTDTTISKDTKLDYVIQCIQTEAQLDSLYIKVNNTPTYASPVQMNTDTVTIPYTYTTTDSIGEYIISFQIQDIYSKTKSITKKITIQ